MKNPLNIKLKAGALQYTLFVSAVIALLLFGFIGLTYTQQKLRLKNTVLKKVINENELTFQLVGHANKQLTNNEIETAVLKKQWGLFTIATITSKKGKEKITKTALLGSCLTDKPALYLQDENQPLVVVGNTRIEGKALLPEQGIKQGSIAGHSYINNQLIYGNVQRSSTQLPKVENFNVLKRFKDSIMASENFEWLDLDNSTEIINPFTEPTQFFYANEQIELQNIQLVGNIIIRSSTKVIIYESAILNDIIIIAPEIEIKKDATGNFQTFAEKKLIVNERVQLEYPTVLLVSEKKSFTNVQNQTAKEAKSISNK